MNLTNRDRTVLLIVVPVIMLVGYWFLLLAPQRKEASDASTELTKQEKRRGDARTQLAQFAAAKKSFKSDYAELVRLGKAIPSNVDMPSLLVQLDTAARGTGIKFARIKKGQRVEAPAPASGASAQGSRPADASGAPAQSAPGKAAETANNTAATANQRSNAAEKTGVDAQTSSSTRQGGLPVGGGATPGGAPAAASGAPGLDTVPLEFTFDGSFFKLADFFHRLKRFVRVANDNVFVRGRLMTIDGVKFQSDPQKFPALTVEVQASVYLTPKAEGATAGATGGGPAGGSGGNSGAPSSGSQQSAPVTPTATATP